MYHVVFNPVAGGRKALKNLAVLERIFQEREVEYAVHESLSCGDITKIVRSLTRKGDNEIIVLGGDGTLHEALNGIEDPIACHLGLVPSGTGNDFAERLGIPMQAEKAVELILKGEIKETDYLEVGGKRCMNVAGLGMDVEVLELCNRGKMKGKLKYLYSLLKCLFTYKGCRIVLKCEGREEPHSVLLAAACNGSLFGGGIKVCPTADVADGKLNVVVVDCIVSVWKIVKAFMVLLRGGILEYPLTTHYLCEEVSFIPETPCSVQLDGEIYKDLQFDVKVKSGLKFYR